MPKVIGETRGVWRASHSVGGASGCTGTISPQLQRAAHVVPSFGLDDDDLGFRAASAMPDARPPPPHGMMIRARAPAPASARAISRPTVPCPATMCGSSKLGTTVAPLSCEMRAAIASRLSRAAVVEDDLGALRPSALDFHGGRIGRHDDDRRGCRAASRRSRRRAHDCPRRKRPRRASAPPRESCSSRLVAPRSLKAPPVCRHSHLSQIRALESRVSISGVRSTEPAIRSAAARTSSRSLVACSAKLLIFHPFD